MNDSDEKQDFLSELNFAPDWAKSSSEKHHNNLRKYDSDDDGGRYDRRAGRGRDGFARDRREPGAGKFGNRRPDSGPRRDRDADRPRPPRSSDAPRQDAFRDRAPARPDTGAPHTRRDLQHSRPHREPPAPVPFEIRFLPDQKALSVIAHKVQSSHKALPLRNLVKLFFDNPDSTIVRLEFNAENKDKAFFQCTKCGWFAMTEDELRQHILAVHFADYFDSQVIEIEPPSGRFTAVARCGITGKLLAPPNHHSYTRKIQNILRTECPGISEKEYREKIETLTDPELIEQWRNESKLQTVYTEKPQPVPEPAKPKKRKGEKPVAAAPAENTGVVAESPAPETTEAETAEPAAETPENTGAVAESPDTPPVDPVVPVEAVETALETEAAPPPQQFTQEEAEDKFVRDILPGLMRSDRHVSATRDVTKTMTDRTIVNAIRRAWDREQTLQTASLFFAVRGGLRSRKLFLFRAGDARRDEFVMSKTPATLDVTHAVPELKMIIDYITEHPGCTRTELLAALTGGDTTTPEQADKVIKQLSWITERGHIIEYYNGVIALPGPRPFFRNIDTHKHAEPQKTDDAAPAAEPTEETAPEAAQPEEATAADTQVAPDTVKDVATEPVPEEDSATPAENPAPVSEEPAPATTQENPVVEPPAEDSATPAPDPQPEESAPDA